MKNKPMYQQLADARRTVGFLTARNFDSNGMHENELQSAQRNLSDLEFQAKCEQADQVAEGPGFGDCWAREIYGERYIERETE